MSRPHALIIDDNRTNAQVLANLLTRQGITSTSVLMTEDLPHVLDALDALTLVFLDLEMPGLNGYDVINLLRADARFEQVPIVAYTVHVSQFQEAYQAGFHSFLAKPIDPKRFPDQLARILNGERVWDRV